MFNPDELRLLESPDTKLKELHLRLSQAEKERTEARRELSKLAN